MSNKKSAVRLELEDLLAEVKAAGGPTSSVALQKKVVRFNRRVHAEEVSVEDATFWLDEIVMFGQKLNGRNT